MKRISTLFLILFLSIIAFSQSATVIKENANLRGTASQSGRIVTVLPNGSGVQVIKQTS